MDEHKENFNKEIENIKQTNKPTNPKKQSELKNTIAEMKNTLERIIGRLDDEEEWISNIEDRVREVS